MIGKKVSHYEITERLGAGGMGVVYRAVDPRLERTVAIKFLGANLSGDPVAKQRFIQEAKSASALDHPNICSIYEIDEDDNGQLFMVMAHYIGRPLDDLLDDGPVSAGEAVGITMQVADGLAKAHSQGILHRDIKPANVMLTEDGLAKILDFGLAKMVGATSLTQSGQSVGTPAYMAPEYLAEGTIDHRADIWALGVLLYELMTGERPFSADHPQAVMYQVVNKDPRPLSEVFPQAPPGVWEVIARCLHKDPDERYQDAGEVRNDLRIILRRLEESGDVSRTSQHAIASSVNVALGMKPARTSQTGAVVGKVAAVIGVVAVLAVTVWGGLKLFQPKPDEALRVLIMPPEVQADDATTAHLVASNVNVAMVQAAVRIDGIVPLEPPRTAEVGNRVSDIAEAVGADEALTVAVYAIGRDWQVRLHRVSASGDVVLWANVISAPREDPLMLANAVVAQLPQAYPEHDTEELGLEVRPQDYEIFLRQHRSFVQLQGDVDNLMLDTLATIRETSPRFADAYLLESRVARRLFDATKSPQLLDRAKEVAELARERFPTDPRASDRLFDIALRAGDLDAARRSIADLQVIDPGGVEVVRRQALVAEKEGDVDTALALMNRVVERRPSYIYLTELVDLEYENGMTNGARQHLRMLIERFPDNRYANSKLAEIELLYGSAEVAEQLYSKLVENRSGVVAIKNLGLAQELQGKYSVAAANFRKSLLMAPDDYIGVLNLADCESMAGNSARSDSLYARVLELMGPANAEEDVDDLIVRAQALAQLGRDREAVATVQDAISRDSENPEAFYAASLVYAVVGEKTSALVNVQKASQMGVTGRWFQLGFFDELRSDAGFLQLLAQDPLDG